MKLVISPYSQYLNCRPNPKNYSLWNEVIKFIKLHKQVDIVQLGVSGDPLLAHACGLFDSSLACIQATIESATVWASVDNFLPHFCKLRGLRPGVVVFSQSDPGLFGYSCNKNLWAGTEHFREDQFAQWDFVPYKLESFPTPRVVATTILEMTGLHLWKG